MAAIEFVGLYWLIPLSLLLTTSFFVLYALRKETSRGLQVFGKVVVAFLWLAAGIVLFTGVYTLVDDAGLGYPGGYRLNKGMMGQGIRGTTCPMIKKMDPHAGLDMGDTEAYHGSAMENPHGGMMKYHDYDEKGNVIIEGEPAANATQQ